MIIDMHCHIVLEGLANALRARTAPPRIERAADGSEQMIRHMGTAAIPGSSVEALLSNMDEHGIERAVLSNLFPDITNIALEDALPLCRAFNDAAAEACARYPDRL